MWLILDGRPLNCATWRDTSAPVTHRLQNYHLLSMSIPSNSSHLRWPQSTVYHYSQPPQFSPSPTRLYPSMDPLFLSSLDSLASFTPPCCDLNLQSFPPAYNGVGATPYNLHNSYSSTLLRRCHRRRHSHPFIPPTSLLHCSIVVAPPPFHSPDDLFTISSTALPMISLMPDPYQHHRHEERSSVLPAINWNPIPLICNTHPPINHLPSSKRNGVLSRIPIWHIGIESNDME